MPRTITCLHKSLTASSEKNARLRVAFWLSLSLLFAAFYGILGLNKAFRMPYVVQDDAREYVFWMQQFVNPELFPNDLIAAYFKSITPLGYASIYQFLANLGISPLQLSKVLPIFLGLLSTAYGFGLCLELFSVPAAGFISTLLLNQSLWFKDDLASATPRAFVYPLLLAFLYYLLRRNWLLVCITIVLQGLFYPPLVLVSIGVLCVRLVQWRQNLPRLSRKTGLYLLLVSTLGGLSILPYLLASSEFGPVVTAAKEMSEFWPGGRHPFFDSNPWKFWLIGEHSGFLPPLLPPLIWLGLLLPFVLRRPDRFPLVRQVSGNITVLSQLVLVSLSLFFAAHALLLKLFFPTRYTVHSLRVVMALAAGITIVILVEALGSLYLRLARSHRVGRLFAIVATTVITGFVLILYPHLSAAFPATNYRVSNEQLLYEFLQQQPQESLIASLSEESNNIPTFAQRAVLTSREYALPFHQGYYQQIYQRSSELIQAQYSQSLVLARQLIQKYKITFWLLEKHSFTPEYLTEKSWLRSFQPAFTDSLTNLKQGIEPALAKVVERCSAFETENLVLLAAGCIVDAAQ